MQLRKRAARTPPNSRVWMLHCRPAWLTRRPYQIHHLCIRLQWTQPLIWPCKAIRAVSYSILCHWPQIPAVIIISFKIWLHRRKSVTLISSTRLVRPSIQPEIVCWKVAAWVPAQREKRISSISVRYFNGHFYITRSVSDFEKFLKE